MPTGLLVFFKNVESDRLWFIKKGKYYDYKRIVWRLFYRVHKPYYPNGDGA